MSLFGDIADFFVGTVVDDVIGVPFASDIIEEVGGSLFDSASADIADIGLGDIVGGGLDQAAVDAAINAAVDAGIADSGLGGYSGVPDLGGLVTNDVFTELGGDLQMVGLPGVVAAGTAVARTVGSRIPSIVANGVTWAGGKVKSLIQKLGIPGAAAVIGVGASELAQYALQNPAVLRKRRRSRGITARDLRRTRQTMNKIVRMYHMLPTRSVGGSRRGSTTRTSIIKA